MATTTPVTADAIAADLPLTPHVVIGQLGTPGRCQAWMDSADRQCSRPTDGHLCNRDRTVAARRRQVRLADIERREAKAAAARAAKVAAARSDLEANRQDLARVEARLAALTAAPVNDRAATGGAVHPSIARKLQASFSPARIAQVGTLTRRADHLREQIALAEQ